MLRANTLLQRHVLPRAWLSFLVLGVAFFVFGACTLNLGMLLVGSFRLLGEHGWQAAMEGGLRQLLDALGRLGVSGQEYGRVLMVGDRHFDIDAAQELGIAAAGVTWGFAEPGELEAAGAQYLVSTAAELEKIVLG